MRTNRWDRRRYRARRRPRLQRRRIGGRLADAAGDHDRALCARRQHRPGSRLFARELSEKLGQQFIIESKGGAGGSIGAAQVAKSKPDGYTLLVTANGPSVLNKMLYASLPYDPETDFTPIALISDVPQVFAVNAKSPVSDLKGLVAFAKEKKEGLTIGPPGVGTGAHLTAIWFANLAGITAVPVAYRGAQPLVTAVIGGEIDAGLPAYIPQVHAAKILAVTSEERVDFLPACRPFVRAALPMWLREPSRRSPRRPERRPRSSPG
jgi:tripartite-type tricarboxylate transporter receptor subunit TctC